MIPLLRFIAQNEPAGSSSCNRSPTPSCPCYGWPPFSRCCLWVESNLFMLRMLLVRRLCRGILPMGLPEYLGMLCLRLYSWCSRRGNAYVTGYSTGSCSCIRPGCLRRAFICLGRLGRVGKSIPLSLVARLIKMIGGPAPIPLQPKAVTNEPLNWSWYAVVLGLEYGLVTRVKNLWVYTSHWYAFKKFV